jgi:dihydroorotate dehydrogenase
VDAVRRLSREVGGRAPIIGVGGVEDASSAEAMLEAGASLVELYTGFVYGGPFVVRTIVDGLPDAQ